MLIAEIGAPDFFVQADRRRRTGGDDAPVDEHGDAVGERENRLHVVLAAQARDGHSFRFWGDARKEKQLRDAAQSALARVGLGHRGEALVSELSHGEQRELELAVALATKPQLLLLDEPMAGLGATESSRMVKLLADLRREVTIILVEHDMNAVFALADRITVLVYGRIIASGAPAAIRLNEEVKRAYLGDQHVVVHHGR